MQTLTKAKKNLDTLVESIISNDLTAHLVNSQTGIEKESLRVNTVGSISQNPHPKAFGSALKNSIITTDYSESLMELITPPCNRAISAYNYLIDIESFVYKHLDNELLWTSSMPCIINGEKDIQIAQYGSSNAGKMKTAYREGLAVRYGKLMQVIAGIHFNYSIDKNFWEPFQILVESKADKQDFINDKYMGMTRNIQRYGWVIPYLFGSSPAICKSFLQGAKPTPTMREHNSTYYEPYGTSLRMGDFGYTNDKEDEIGVKANYNSLEGYISSLRNAISTPHQTYADLGIKQDDKTIQLNANILQIENEYYSTVRPKQILQGFEKPTCALERRGVEYVELRSVDINSFHPAGLTKQQLYFLEIFMVFCLLSDSPDLDTNELKEVAQNQLLVTHQGRKPELELSYQGNVVALKDWGNKLIACMFSIATLLDKTHNESCYHAALFTHQQMFANPDLTPSAKVLEEIKNTDGNYYSFARRMSEQHRDYYLNRELDDEFEASMKLLAEKSIQSQQEIEANDELDFDTFLQHYFENKLD